MNIEHDEVVRTNNVIETPSWSKFDPLSVEQTLSEENTEDDMYAELHVPFEEHERRRYVMTSLNNEDPFVVGFSAIQFMKIEPKEELIHSYKYPPIRPLNPILADINEINSKKWSCSVQNGFNVHFKILE
ncbi:hypothetical protein KM1_188680 [Entamoeba histolytica HM-3:IMSS]|uniref:PEHE domain-containing protein n=5 Tax=Entamoeba histolytica TaxID=5759 RepID=C4M8Z8_ENTH1|nr:hypothetical protein EHI_038270 [Entamoeba histolytica HM-1:IMSS]EMD45266.1 Hypothetical protein EHI5A_144260 [Entamoeba histolytica KU27]EMS11919.1 hypothetical protein KM1_188680 [Entamoeba histolytica HM-3:IMSS]ENY65104.1 hypothetical protein EHI7A_104250 [Entamoeba histolytica HM-1:IMSS-A]GAT98105.1 hypothetical protein CL6EHI_038270 [Entamoeba histolytica]EAL48317.1 hypothetical protein EHI_038270 [Entamoeba histolytica HM-1:IMSS]|eukprot:XP_653705.1 hypothetical protein EHI_038270 [Entamoeba histolytica HM-1:IMSS]